jgi:hypothetical protein
MFEIQEKVPDGRVFYISCGGQQLISNCGATVEYGFSAYAVRPGSGYGSSRVRVTLREIYAVLDKYKTTHIIPSVSKGFHVLSDNFLLSRNPGLRSLDKPFNEESYMFTTKDFVNWLISRKIGTVWRGPCTVNRNHPNGSVLSCWIWVPVASNILSLETEVFNAPEELKPEYPALLGTAKLHIEEQRYAATAEIDISKVFEKKEEEVKKEEVPVPLQPFTTPPPAAIAGAFYRGNGIGVAPNYPPDLAKAPERMPLGNYVDVPLNYEDIIRDLRAWHIERIPADIYTEDLAEVVKSQTKRQYVRRKGHKTVTDELKERNVPHLRNVDAQPG